MMRKTPGLNAIIGIGVLCARWRRVGLALAMAAGLPLAVAATEAAASIGPNFCLTGSTATDCLMQIDIFNVGGSPPNHLASGYIGIDVKLLSSNMLEFSLQSRTINGVTYGFNNLYANFVNSMTGMSITQISNTTRSGLNNDVFGPVATGSFNADGWGTFNTKIPDSNNPSDPATSLVFDLTWCNNPGCLSLTDLLTTQFMLLNGSGNGNSQGSGGQSFAVEMIPFNSDGNLATGFGASPACQDQTLTNCSVVIATPAPTSLTMIGGGLLACAIAILRRRRAA